MSDVSVDTCIVGLGPAGLGAAVEFAAQGEGRGVVCIEAGVAPADQFCTILGRRGCRKASPCHMVSGVGGAEGTTRPGLHGDASRVLNTRTIVVCKVKGRRCGGKSREISVDTPRPITTQTLDLLVEAFTVPGNRTAD